MLRTENPLSPTRRASSPLMSPEKLLELSAAAPEVRELAWKAFYPRARAIAAAKLRKHFGLRAGIDDQDADDAVDAAIGILYRRSLLAPPSNPVNQPYALLVSISVHLLPKYWKQRKRERELTERIARFYPESFESNYEDFSEPRPNAYAENFARWLALQFEKSLPTMPKAIKAGMIGTLFRETGLIHLLDVTLDTLPEARRRHCRLYHDIGLSTTQIAQRCGCGPSNISNSLRRCWVAFNDSQTFQYALEQIADGRYVRHVPPVVPQRSEAQYSPTGAES